MFRVVKFGKSVPFSTYSEALQYQYENGGTIYVRVYPRN